MNSKSIQVKSVEDVLSQDLNKAVQFHTQGRFREAEVLYKSILKIRPNHFDAKQLLGLIRLRQGRHEEAAKLLMQAISLNSDVAAVHANLGLAFNALNRFDEALNCYEKAIELEPNNAGHLHDCGAILLSQNRPEDALAKFDKAIGLQPNYVEAFCNRGVALRELGRFDEALASYDQALALKSSYVDALYNRGNVLGDLKRTEEAIESLSKAIALKFDHKDAIYNRAVLMLSLGDYASGLLGYEARFEKTQPTKKTVHLPFPVWTGEPIDGKRIVISDEQGAGDVIQFTRYLPLLVSRGAKVTFIVRQELHRLLAPFAEHIRLVSRYSNERYEFQCPLLGLPRAFRTNLDNIPTDVPYLFADEAAVERWSSQLDSTRFKIGIAWQGNPNTRVDLGRSIPLKFFDPVFRIPGVQLYSLQKNYGTEQLLDLTEDIKINTFGINFDNGADAFIDTAAVMAKLDLVITSDTSIAHLAGALGRPVWLALQYVPEWRWFLDRSDSPWYPTMRLYRQTTRGDWAGVFREISADLSIILRGRSVE